MKKRLLVVVAAGVLILGVTVGSSLARFTDSEQVINTFSVGKVAIDLDEHVYEPDTKMLGSDTIKENLNYVFVSGQTLPKDPFVTVKAGSLNCWVFIRVKEMNNDLAELTPENDEPQDIIKYGMASGWIPMPGHDEYYYQEVSKSNSDTVLYVLSGDTYEHGQIKVNENVTKDLVTQINAQKPQLVFTAAAIQNDPDDTVEIAWSRLPDAFTGPK